MEICCHKSRLLFVEVGIDNQQLCSPTSDQVGRISSGEICPTWYIHVGVGNRTKKMIQKQERMERRPDETRRLASFANSTFAANARPAVGVDNRVKQAQGSARLTVRHTGLTRPLLLEE